jgi:hypothetical protein
MEYLENINIEEVKAKAIKAKKFAEQNAPALIVGLLALIALIALVSLYFQKKQIRELKKLRRVCNSGSSKKCDDCLEDLIFDESELV